ETQRGLAIVCVAAAGDEEALAFEPFQECGVVEIEELAHHVRPGIAVKDDVINVRQRLGRESERKRRGQPLRSSPNRPCCAGDLSYRQDDQEYRKKIEHPAPWTRIFQPGDLSKIGQSKHRQNNHYGHVITYVNVAPYPESSQTGQPRVDDMRNLPTGVEGDQAKRCEQPGTQGVA